MEPIKMKKIYILYDPSGNPVREIKLKDKKHLAQEARVFEAEPTIESFTIGNERNCDFRNLKEAHESLFGYTCVGC
ncbi:MAG: hypothetical protein A2V51_00455 [Candidatus Dadabacteria bacterium RBG_19FT_COMBO_40_33]|jgi:hypothetical protein|nr:MAG: hypothetical protein A2V51_00455 [Candidatus Dadabacteria bacterium RBG_19FT_COMBO_40_33]